jgi:DNA anti-recombination protein RmuC
MDSNKLSSLLPSISGNPAIDLALLAVLTLGFLQCFKLSLGIFHTSAKRRTKGRELRKTLEIKAKDLESLRASLASARAETSEEIERMHREQARQSAEVAKQCEREFDPRFRELEEQLADAVTRPRQR